MFIPSQSLRRAAILLGVGLVLSTVAVADTRTWVDSSGKHRVEAELVSLKDGVVTLRNSTGKEIVLTIDRLSQDDQTFIRQHLAKSAGSAQDKAGPAGKSPVGKSPVGKSAVGKPAVGKPAAAKPVAKRFYAALIDQHIDELKTLLTPAAQSNWEATKTLIEGLDVPDSRQAVLVRTATATDDMADVNISIKVRGKFQKQHLKLRWSDGQWLVASLIPDGEDASPINFEGDRDGLSSSGDAGDSQGEDDPAEDDADKTADDPEAEQDADVADGQEDKELSVFRVPDGSPAELLAYIEELKRTKPPQNASRQELLDLQSNMLLAMLEAANKVLDADPSKSDAESAAQTKLQTLSMLGRMSPDPALAKSLETFPQQLKEMGFNDLAQSAQSVVLTVAIANVRTPDEGQKVIGQVRNHLKVFDKLKREEISLARSAGSLAERVDDRLAAEVYTEIAAIMDKDPETRPLAEIMRGTARRLNLVGNPMELAGLTSAEQPFDLAQLKGKIVLVDFWATWCGPCLQELPNIRKNYEKYHDLGFDVVAVSVDQDLNALKKFVDEEAPPWLVVVDEHPRNTRKMGEYYGISAIPTTILVGADGKVITFNCRGERLGAELARLLGGGAS